MNNRKLIDCVILEGYPQGLESEIKSFIEDGWELNGTLLPYQQVFVQSMAKYEDLPEEDTSTNPAS